MAMWRSPDPILTTHGGNLPPPANLENLITSWQDHRPEIEDRLPSAIAEVVDKRLDCGVTILNEGEYVKAASGADYVGYVHSRVTGWETRPVDPAIPAETRRRRGARSPAIPRLLRVRALAAGLGRSGAARILPARRAVGAHHRTRVHVPGQVHRL